MTSSEHRSNDFVQAFATVDQICDEFESDWKRKSAGELETYLHKADSKIRKTLLEELIVIDLCYRAKSDQAASPKEYETRFPNDSDTISRSFRKFAVGNGDAETWHMPAIGEVLNCRYKIVRELGKGGFGKVYLGFDETLARDVAIKIPLQRHYGNTSDLLDEAKVLAKLQHPNIVSVFDADRLDDGRVFFVSAFIDGQSLHERLRTGKLSEHEACALIETVARTLEYAHQQNIIHRDVKPANILLDKTGSPHIADFGLALDEDDTTGRRAQGGSVDYMSPEQLRGEGHLVNRRSDIYSLGVVFYQLLTGNHPRTLRRNTDNCYDIDQVQEELSLFPLPLSCICLKMLAPLAADRFASASDVADAICIANGAPRGSRRKGECATVIPRGLRSYDERDAQFFLELLPGPYDEQGIPDSVRFWQQRINETDPQRTFRVGVMYGPSGCGKSSLMRAGIIPLLGEHVKPIFFEARGDDDAGRLEDALREHFPIAGAGDLTDMMRHARKHLSEKRTHKTLIVIDQLEQWLHNQPFQEDGELARALRQCDGKWLQCVVLIRADFWMPLSRLMRHIDVTTQEHGNARVVDLFSEKHAQRVLAMIGHAFGQFPLRLDNVEHLKFVETAIQKVEEDGRVSPFRIVVLAELLRNKPWTQETLASFDDLESLLLSFFDDTFRSEQSHPHARQHEAAACRVLRQLLPVEGTDIRGHSKTYAELSE
ncbi:MAG: protein kinase, partial [Planctomycetales bacterium]|nr:protein kinase [Planctomycetales bacterium]